LEGLAAGDDAENRDWVGGCVVPVDLEVGALLRVDVSGVAGVDGGRSPGDGTARDGTMAFDMKDETGSTRGPRKTRMRLKMYHTHCHCRRIEVEPASSVSAYITRDSGTALTRSPSPWIGVNTRRSSR
jgi:hypothetical protein